MKLCAIFRLTGWLVILMGSFSAVSAAEPAAPAVTLEHTERRTVVAQKIPQTSYELLVSLPEDYATSGKSYPVLYVLDGWHFAFMAFLQENNLYSGRMPPVIMVNVSHGDGPDVMARRARDFLPTASAQEKTAGGAAAFLDFIEHELIPLIDRTYRTQPADRALLGHSYGGTFALYALEQRPALFQRIVAASPAVDWDDNLLIKAARERLKVLPAAVRLDLSVAADQDYTGPVKAFAEVLAELQPKNLDWRLTVFPDENHNSVRTLSFPAGLRWVYRPGADAAK